MNPHPLLMIAAGGTGGHMFPAQALAEEMLQRGWRVRLSTDARGASYSGGFPGSVEIEQIISASPVRGGITAKLAVPFRIAFGVAQASFAMRRTRPDVVAGFGGYPTIPALSAAIINRIPRIIHEQNGVLGRVNRHFAPYAAEVACGTWPTALPAKAKGKHYGNPVRAQILERAATPYAAPGLHPMNVAVIGGSQGAKVLTDTVPAALAALPGDIKTHLRVTHQARPDDVARAEAAYLEAGIQANVASFFDNIPELLSEAQLVICRAGASTLAEMAVIGRPAILIPYPYATADHQTANARAFKDAGAAEILPESGLSVDQVSETILSILGNPAHAQSMAKAAVALSRPNAAKTLADRVEAMRMT